MSGNNIRNVTKDDDNQEGESLEEVQVYRSLGQVWKALGSKSSSPEIQSLANLCLETGLQGKGDGSGDVISSEAKPTYLNQKKEPHFPFIVVEGLDGTGKTTLTKFLSTSLGIKLLSTPPKFPAVQNVRSYFDDQPESVRRAFYSLGNYLAAQQVINTPQAVVMDRYWHSTAAYALAHQIRTGGPEPKVEDFIWPHDLLKPDLVIFLQVTEEERVRRHTHRKDFTNTKEEQTLADDAAFRKNLMECYRRVAGPKFHELNVDGEKESSQAKILKAVLENIPTLNNSEKKQQVC